jgi:hypothetical protein
MPHSPVRILELAVRVVLTMSSFLVLVPSYDVGGSVGHLRGRECHVAGVASDLVLDISCHDIQLPLSLDQTPLERTHSPHPEYTSCMQSSMVMTIYVHENTKGSQQSSAPPEGKRRVKMRRSRVYGFLFVE